MENPVKRRTPLGTLKTAQRTAFGMKYWMGTIRATGRTTLPISERAFAGSFR